jgi:hypothetical protein
MSHGIVVRGKMEQSLLVGDRGTQVRKKKKEGKKCIHILAVGVIMTTTES